MREEHGGCTIRLNVGTSRIQEEENRRGAKGVSQRRRGSSAFLDLLLTWPRQMVCTGGRIYLWQARAKRIFLGWAGLSDVLHAYHKTHFMQSATANASVSKPTDWPWAFVVPDELIYIYTGCTYNRGEEGGWRTF